MTRGPVRRTRSSPPSARRSRLRAPLATINNQIGIRVKSGVYNENLTLPPFVHLHGETGELTYSTRLNGSVTFTATPGARSSMTGFYMEVSGATAFTVSGTGAILDLYGISANSNGFRPAAERFGRRDPGGQRRRDPEQRCRRRRSGGPGERGGQPLQLVPRQRDQLRRAASRRGPKTEPGCGSSVRRRSRDRWCSTAPPRVRSPTSA